MEDIDEIIHAQLPDPDLDPELYECVTGFMLHGPCGPGYPKAPCMEDGRCTKGFPKEFCEETTIPAEGGYPSYARPQNGRIFVKNGFTFDNRWVVSYNPALLKKFHCHINVEWVGSFLSIKYVYKYIHKGVDVSTVALKSGEKKNDKDVSRQIFYF